LEEWVTTSQSVRRSLDAASRIVSSHVVKSFERQRYGCWVMVGPCVWSAGCSSLGTRRLDTTSVTRHSHCGRQQSGSAEDKALFTCGQRTVFQETISMSPSSCPGSLQCHVPTYRLPRAWIITGCLIAAIRNRASIQARPHLPYQSPTLTSEML
jgi:hypothetical protein